MFRDRAVPVALAATAKHIAAWFHSGSDRPPQPPRTVTAILATRDAPLEARLLAPAIRACQARGDTVEVRVLPARDEASFADDAVRRLLDVERIDLIPPPRPVAAGGPVQSEMRHAYRAYEFLKSRPPDLVLATQTLGVTYYAIRARQMGIGLQRTRFAIVLAPFELQRRLNERRVTSEAFALIRFHLEQAVAADADVAVAPSRRFVENALQTGAAVEGSPFVVLPELVTPVKSREAAPGRPAGFVIPDVAPLARNIAFFATVAKRRPDALRDAEGCIRLSVDAQDRSGALASLCGERFAGTDVEWTIGGGRGDNGQDGDGRSGSARRDRDRDNGAELLFVPYCEDFFALGGVLAPVLDGVRLIIGTGAAAGEPFEAAGIAVPPYPDEVANAIAQAAEGRRGLSLASRPPEREACWKRYLDALAPPGPVDDRDAAAPAGTRDEPAPRVSVCILHFNRPTMAEQAVASVLAQAYEPIEILIFDDGSHAPGAVEALEALVAAHDGRIRLIRQDNRYLGAARNGAARAATGDYVYFLDDDNVLKPEAIATLVKAAETTGADFLGSFSDIFRGNGPPRAATAGWRILQAGDDGGFTLFQNAILDGNALCRRDAFLELGGNTEDYGIGKDDQEFFARAVRAGRRVAIVPEALFWARHGTVGLKSLHFDPHAGHFRVLQAYWPTMDPRYRGLLLLVQGLFIEREEWLENLRQKVAAARMRPVMALARRGRRLGLDRLEIDVRLNPEWIEQALERRDAEPEVELRRNGRPLVRARVRDVVRHALRLPVTPRMRPFGETLYSIHDAATSEALAALLVPARRWARDLEGAVENRPRPEVRGWVLDPKHPEQCRRVAIHVDGWLSDVLQAGELRGDIARWKRTAGFHGFCWRIPWAVAQTDGARLDVFDADTGQPLPGSPVRVEGGRVVASEAGAS